MRVLATWMCHTPTILTDDTMFLFCRLCRGTQDNAVFSSALHPNTGDWRLTAKATSSRQTVRILHRFYGFLWDVLPNTSPVDTEKRLSCQCCRYFLSDVHVVYEPYLPSHMWCSLSLVLVGCLPKKKNVWKVWMKARSDRWLLHMKPILRTCHLTLKWCSILNLSRKFASIIRKQGSQHQFRQVGLHADPPPPNSLLLAPVCALLHSGRLTSALLTKCTV